MKLDKDLLAEHALRVRAARKLTDQSLDALARALNVSKTSVTRWEAGLCPMPPQMVARWAELSGIADDVRAWIVFGGSVPNRAVAAALKAAAADVEENRRQAAKRAAEKELPVRKRASGEARR